MPRICFFRRTLTTARRGSRVTSPPAFPRPVAAIAAGVVLLAVLAWVFFRQRMTSEPGIAGHSVEGRPISYTVHGEGPRVVLFMASIHGSEGAGTPLLEEMTRHLEKNPDTLRGATAILLPVANPDGLARGDRLNVHGVDLNRNFPADNRRDTPRFGLAPLSEPESRALHSLILNYQPQVIVSIHQPLACVDWDGPPETLDLAIRLANGCGLPVKKLGARPGSLGAWFGEVLGRPILTLELPRHAPGDGAALWQRYGPGLLAVLDGT
jgi:protein MpaA